MRGTRTLRIFCEFDGQRCRNVLPAARPLHSLQLIKGVSQLPLNRGFVTEDALKLPALGQAEMVCDGVPLCI